MSQTGYVSMDVKPTTPSPSSAAKDPFYVVKDKVQTYIRTLLIEFDRWKDLLEQVDTATNAEFKSKNNSVRSTVKKLKGDVIDLQKTIQIVEQNRSRFPDIDDDELAKRKKFVNDTRGTLEEVVRTTNSERTKKKLADDRIRATAPPPPMTLEQKQRQAEERTYVDDRSSQQQNMVEEQDVVLGDMHEALVRLGDIATTMDVELEQQNSQLKELGDDVDDVQGDLNTVNAKIEKLLGTSDKGKLCCIFFLFVVVVILFFIIIYG